MEKKWYLSSMCCFSSFTPAFVSNHCRSEDDESQKGNDDDEENEKEQEKEDDDYGDNYNEDEKVEIETESSLTINEGKTLVESMGKKALAPLLVKAGMVFHADDDNDMPNLKAPVDRAAAMAASKESSRNLAGTHLMRPSP